MNQNLSTIGILFDVSKIEQYVDPGNYLTGAWKIVWRALGPTKLKDWRGAFLYECDYEGVDACCIAIQSTDRYSLKRIRKSLLRNTDYQSVAWPPSFLEDESVRTLPLMDAGMIDANGNIFGEKAYCSKPALDSVKKEFEKRSIVPVDGLNAGDSGDEVADHRGVKSSVAVGDHNAGYRVITVKKGIMDHLSIVLAEKVDVTAPTKYVIWAFDGVGFKSGIYRDDRDKAKKAYDSRRR